jgi:hypothetical protein
MAIEDIKVDLKSIWVSFVEAVVRFWSNRFQLHNDEVLYLRDRVAQLHNENQQLYERLISFNSPKIEEQPVNIEDFKPIQTGRVRTSWSVTKAKLEADSRREAIKLAQEAAEATKAERTQTTEDIEKELGIE